MAFLPFIVSAFLSGLGSAANCEPFSFLQNPIAVSGKSAPFRLASVMEEPIRGLTLSFWIRPGATRERPEIIFTLFSQTGEGEPLRVIEAQLTQTIEVVILSIELSGRKPVTVNLKVPATRAKHGAAAWLFVGISWAMRMGGADLFFRNYPSEASQEAVSVPVFGLKAGSQLEYVIGSEGKGIGETETAFVGYGTFLPFALPRASDLAAHFQHSLSQSFNGVLAAVHTRGKGVQNLRATGRFAPRVKVEGEHSFVGEGLQFAPPTNVALTIAASNSSFVPSFTASFALKFVAEDKIGIFSANDTLGNYFEVFLAREQSSKLYAIEIHSKSDVLSSPAMLSSAGTGPSGFSIARHHNLTTVLFFIDKQIFANETKTPFISGRLLHVRLKAEMAESALWQHFAVHDSPLPLLLSAHAPASCLPGCGLSLSPGTKPTCALCTEGVLLPKSNGCARYCPVATQNFGGVCLACAGECPTVSAPRVERVAEDTLIVSIGTEIPAITELSALNRYVRAHSPVELQPISASQFRAIFPTNARAYGQSVRLELRATAISGFPSAELNAVPPFSIEYTFSAIRLPKGNDTQLGAFLAFPLICGAGMAFVFALIGISLGETNGRAFGYRKLLISVQRLQLTALFAHFGAVYPPNAHTFIVSLFAALIGYASDSKGEKPYSHPNFFDRQISPRFSQNANAFIVLYSFLVFVFAISKVFGSNFSKRVRTLSNDICVFAFLAFNAQIAFFAALSITESESGIFPVFVLCAALGFCLIAAARQFRKEKCLSKCYEYATAAIYTFVSAAIAASERPLLQTILSAILFSVFIFGVIAIGRFDDRREFFLYIFSEISLFAALSLVAAIAVLDRIGNFSLSMRDCLGFAFIAFAFSANFFQCAAAIIPFIARLFTGEQANAPRFEDRRLFAEIDKALARQHERASQRQSIV